MKTAYIIFRNAKPRDSKATLNLIVEFCREHELDYQLRPKSGGSMINIEGKDYYIKLEEKKEDSESAYWMICCLLKGKTASALCRNIA